MTKTADLSQLQRYILGRLAQWPGNVSVRELRQGAPKTAKESATFSRSLRRLERRRLVTCYVLRRAKPGERAGMLALSPQGRALATRRSIKL
jgi:DNA-binding MarR family transcriptional regulator